MRSRAGGQLFQAIGRTHGSQSRVTQIALSVNKSTRLQHQLQDSAMDIEVNTVKEMHLHIYLANIKQEVSDMVIAEPAFPIQ